MLGWSGGDGVLVRQSFGKRIRISYQPLKGLVRFPLLDIPVAAGSAYEAHLTLTVGVSYAPPHSTREIGAPGR